MAAEILRPRFRLAHNRSGANLVSGVASTLLAAGDAELGLLEVDEAALPEVLRRVRPRAVCLGNLFRDQLDRYGELELIAERWRDAVAALPAGTQLVLNGDDPQVGSLGRPERRLRPRRSARGAPVAPARRRLEVLHPLRHAVRLRRRLRRPSRRLPLPELRSCAAAARGVGPRDRARRPRARRVRPRDAGGHPARRARAARPLQRLQRARRGGARARARQRRSTRSSTGSSRFSAAFGRFERIPVDGKRLLLLLIKNPAGANEAVRTLVDGGPPKVAVVALNDAIADGRDVSWIWDVDFEPLLEGSNARRHAASRAAELALRFKLRRPRRVAHRRRARPRARARSRARAHAGRAASSSCCRPTRRCSPCSGSSPTRGLAKPYWERAA